MIEFVFLEEFVAVVVVFGISISTAVWRLNKKIEGKADKEEVEKIDEMATKEDLKEIEKKLDKINLVLYGDEDISKTGFVKAQTDRIEELEEELDRVNTRNSAILYMVSEGMDNEENIRNFIEDQNN